MERFFRELRYSLRTLRRNPGFTCVVVLTMALGVGGSTAIFSFIRGILLRPLAYPDGDRLVTICESRAEQPVDWCAASPGNIADWSRASRTIEAMGLARDWPFMVGTSEGKHEGVAGGVVASRLFQVFEVRPERGRLLDAGDSEPGREPVALVTDAYWRTRLGGAEDVIGRRVQVDATTRAIVGVLPAGFEVPGLPRVEMWIPIWPERRDWRWWRGFRSFGRLAAGSTLQQARAEMSGLRTDLEPLDPNANAGWVVTVDSLRDRMTRSVRPALLVFLAAVGFVLLIACANVANLLLAQGSAREREFVVKAALGARPRRLVGQMMVESLVLAMLGGGVGWIAASWGTASLLSLAPGDIPRLEEVRMDASVLAFAIVLSATTSFLFGLIPAWHASRPQLQEALKEGRHTLQHPMKARARNLLVTAEVALAMLLLIAAGLLMRSFANLLDWRPGFDRGNLVIVQVFSSPGSVPEARRVGDLFAGIEKDLASIPGVVSAAAVSAVPLRGGDGEQEFTIEGRPVPAVGEKPTVSWFDMGPGYFRTIGIALRKGRNFTDADGWDAPRVAIVNEAMANRYFPDEDPVGRRVTLEASQLKLEIVGVVADVPPFRPDERARPEIYWPLRQVPRWGTMFAIRTAGDPAAMVKTIRARLEGVTPELQIGTFTTMEEIVGRELVRPRFNTLLMAAFSFLALLLSMVGVYGVISCAVEQRTHEIGVRLAFGARRADVMRLVILGGMKWTLAGVAIGLAGAYPLMLLLKRLLINVSPGDPATFAGVAVILVMVALAAAYIPARRATGVDPMVALRCE